MLGEGACEEVFSGGGEGDSGGAAGDVGDGGRGVA